MENYRRQPNTAEIDQEHALPPPAIDEMRITTQGKINNYVSRGMAALQKQQQNSITLTGKGNSINKTVTVAEIIKRRMKGALHQYTQIGAVSTTDSWDAVQKDLDRLVVTRNQPAITIHLAVTAIQGLEQSSGYQPPTGNDIYLI